MNVRVSGCGLAVGTWDFYLERITQIVQSRIEEFAIRRILHIRGLPYLSFKGVLSPDTWHWSNMHPSDLENVGIRVGANRPLLVYTTTVE